MLASLFEELAAKKGVWKKLTNPVIDVSKVIRFSLLGEAYLDPN
jgi:hypothetical protein